MSLYALARLLKSRDLGPAQLGPAISANRTAALRLAAELGKALDLLRTSCAGSPELRAALDLLAPAAMSLASEIAEAFGAAPRPKLGAKERLRLERSAETLGRQLEGVRSLLTLVWAASESKPAEVLLSDVIDGRGLGDPTFVARRAEVRVELGEDRTCHADPRVLWPLLEASLRQVCQHGQVVKLRVSPDPSGGKCMRVHALVDSAANGHSNGVRQIAVGAPLELEREIVALVARHAGIRYEVTPTAAEVTLSVP